MMMVLPKTTRHLPYWHHPLLGTLCPKEQWPDSEGSSAVCDSSAGADAGRTPVLRWNLSDRAPAYGTDRGGPGSWCGCDLRVVRFCENAKDTGYFGNLLSFDTSYDSSGGRRAGLLFTKEHTYIACSISTDRPKTIGGRRRCSE